MPRPHASQICTEDACSACCIDVRALPLMISPNRVPYIEQLQDQLDAMLEASLASDTRSDEQGAFMVGSH